MKILLIEDDPSTAEAISEFLSKEKYTVDTADNGEIGLELAAEFEYDLILLDVMLPKLDGISVCCQLRDRSINTPILLLTAKNRPGDCVAGLEAGADDYLVKPFDWSELLARLQALLRRGDKMITHLYTWNELELNINTHEVTYAGKSLHLTPKEYNLLELFLRNPRRLFNRQAIIDQIWSLDKIPGEEAVTTHIKALRQKLKAAGMTEDLIETVYGLGYRLQKPANQEKEESLPLIAAEQQLQLKIAQIWERFKGEFQADLNCLVEIIGQLCSQEDENGEQQKKAKAIAHRLSGSLGVFRKTEASQILAEIEQLLEKPKDKYWSQYYQQILELVNRLESTFAQEKWELSLPKIPSICLLLVGVAEELVEQIKPQALLRNQEVKAVYNLNSARQILQQGMADLVILDLDFFDTKEAAMAFLAELSKKYNRSLPLLLLSNYNDLNYRLAVARLGKSIFLHKPLTSDRLLEAVSHALGPRGEIDATLMIVDDDPQVLVALKGILELWGFKVVSLGDTQDFWEVLEKVMPDLLILDVEMPHFSGVELCRIIRNDDRFAYLPILFLSVHQDFQTVQQVLSIGADDYLSKPFVAEELIARIFKQIERSSTKLK